MFSKAIRNRRSTKAFLTTYIILQDWKKNIGHILTKTCIYNRKLNRSVRSPVEFKSPLG